MTTTIDRDRPEVRAHIQRGGGGSIVGGAVLIAGCLVLAALPYLVGPGTTSELVKLFYLMTLASMWNLLAGYAGLFSIGQQAYIGLGAYLLFVVNDAGVPVWGGSVIVVGLVALIAWPVSYLAFRLRGGYFAVGTWVMAEVARLLIVRFPSLGAGSGRSIENITAEPILRRAYTYWLSLVVIVATVTAVYALLRSRIGLDLQAVRDDEGAANSLGVSVTRGKRIAFVLAAAGSAAAGVVICTSSLGIASPGAIFGVQYSAFMIFMVVIGGMGTVEGPLVGAVVYFLLDKYFAQSGVWYLAAVGLTASAVALYLPRGLWGTVAHRYRLALFPVRYHVRPRR